MNQPNLFIIGAPKCGTTSLARWLAKQDDVFLPSVKEPHYYNFDEKHRFYFHKKEYLSLYSEGEKNAYRLDASTWYLHSRVAVDNILRDCPDAKFIVCLRNPVDMAFSLHRHLVNKTGKETVTNFSQAWALSDDRLNGQKVPSLATDPRYLAYKYSCRIGSQTERLMSSVKNSQVKLVLFDELVGNPSLTLSGILRFLNIKASTELELPHLNDGLSLKYPAIQRGIVHTRNYLRHFGVKKWPESIKGMFRIILPAAEKSKMTEEERIMLTRYFHSEIAKIWKLYGEERQQWRSCLS